MEVELDMSLDKEELEERIAIMASDQDIKIICYSKSRRVFVREVKEGVD